MKRLLKHLKRLVLLALLLSAIAGVGLGFLSRAHPPESGKYVGNHTAGSGETVNYTFYLPDSFSEKSMKSGWMTFSRQPELFFPVTFTYREEPFLLFFKKGFLNIDTNFARWEGICTTHGISGLLFNSEVQPAPIFSMVNTGRYDREKIDRLALESIRRQTEQVASNNGSWIDSLQQATSEAWEATRRFFSSAGENTAKALSDPEVQQGIAQGISILAQVLMNGKTPPSAPSTQRGQVVTDLYGRPFPSTPPTLDDILPYTQVQPYQRRDGTWVNGHQRQKPGWDE